MKARSNCFVLTGGPSVGKTTIIRQLEASGAKVLAEAAAQVILKGQFHPSLDLLAFQRAVLALQQEREAQLMQGELYYLDRGVLDGAAYCQLHLEYSPQMFWQTDVSHYRLALVLEPLEKFEQNGVRPDFEDLNYTIKLTPMIEEFYQLRGVPTVRVPAMPVSERLDFIQETVNSFSNLL